MNFWPLKSEFNTREAPIHGKGSLRLARTLIAYIFLAQALRDLPTFKCLPQRLGQHCSTTHLLPDEDVVIESLTQVRVRNVSKRCRCHLLQETCCARRRQELR